MIRAASGTFSTRYPLPARNSVALAIKNRLLLARLQIAHNAACYAHATGVADPYRRIRRPNHSYLVFAAGPETPPKPHAMADDRMRTRACYCPWVFSTVSQATEILGRFSCRHARMVKSP